MTTTPNSTARSDSDLKGSGFPETLPGHWDTAEGREMAERYLARSRRDLCKGELSDLALANAQYLEDISVGTVTFQSAIGMQTAAKERIRWLSAHLAEGLGVASEICAILDCFVDAEGTFDDDPNGLVNDLYKSGVHEKLTAFIAKARGAA